MYDMGVIHPEISKAETLSSKYYTDVTMFSKILEKFETSWNFIGHKAMMEDVTKKSIHVGCEPMILTKDESVYNCISNVCTHRGMVLVDGCENGNAVVCPYHGRTFSLSGGLRNMPEFEGVQGYPSEADDLVKAEVACWKNLLFAKLSGDYEFSRFISTVEARMSFLKLDSFRYNSTMDRSHKIKTNWMLYVDNYLEGFHIPFVHKDLNSILDFTSYDTELFENGVLQVGFAKEGEAIFEIPKGHVDYGKSIAAYYWWLFPNLMLNFYPWGMSLNLVKPIDVGSTEVIYHGFVLDETKLGLGAGGDLDKVEMEDQYVVEACYVGMKSKNYDSGRYSPKMEKGVHHFHRLLTD